MQLIQRSIRGKSALTDYQKKTRNSRRMYNSARKFMVGGQSHNARFFDPYPFFAARASGKFIWDIDGNRYTDYWMGHTALMLGHSPRVVSREIVSQSRQGLLFGTPNKFAFELGELVSRTVPCAESVRFCTSGAEAAMYAVRLARAFTKRKKIAKIAGGWHGYSSSLAVGVSPPYHVPESRGLVPDEDKLVELLEFNDIEKTRKVLKENSKDLACVIVEPVVGAGGVIPASKEYLLSLKEECERMGSILIFDEIITGFRLALGGAQEHFKIKPDLCTLGKILGGGLPVSAVAGQSEIMSLADTTVHTKKERCWIGGGTFSESPLCMRAGVATLKFLLKNRSSVYEKINSLGDRLRKSLDRTFEEQGIRTRTTGLGSLFATHFLNENQEEIRSPRDVGNSAVAKEKEFCFSLIAEHGIFFLPGHIGAISTEHNSSDVGKYLKAAPTFSRREIQARASRSPKV